MRVRSGSPWTSVGRFVATAAKPLPVAGNIHGWATLALVTASAVGGFFQPWIWIAGLVLVAALLSYAGVQLQIEKDVREQPTFSVTLAYHRGPAQQTTAVGHFTEKAQLWAVVKNQGPAAEFVARVHGFKGIEHSGDYLVENLAWEYGRDQARYLIERGSRARIRLGLTRRTGRPLDPKMSLRFFLSHAGIWGNGKPGEQGMGMDLAHGRRVTFYLDVLNVTADQPTSRRVLLLFDEDGTIADFRIGWN